ncbi:MAG: 23S rRNA (guanosine(2251)-2'-O)-methyltransferase RlmB [Rhodothermia bacterium]|nr:23S rRNA (guanosine(2251)-2'-O)-methyltransferase RlmB [Rhodothermia bacterium]
MSQRRGNKSEKVGLIAGRNPVMEALSRRGPSVEKVFVQKGTGGAAVSEIRSLAGRHGVPVQYVPRARLDEIARGLNHQGVAATASPVEYLGLEVLISSLGASIDEVRTTRPILIVLDRIQDPHNFGAILRSAAGAAVGGIVVSSSNMAPISAATIKASAGTAGAVPIARVSSIAAALTQLKEFGFWVIGLDGQSDQTIWSTDWHRPVAIVVGSEGSGMAPNVSSSCDERVAIPLSAGVESLNASVAAAITMFEAVRARA